MSGKSMFRQDGATVVEYALIVAFVAMAVVVTVIAVGNNLDVRYQEILACVQDKTAAACE